MFNYRENRKTSRMDWPRENLGISEVDLKKVFKYEPKETSVVRLRGSDDEIIVRSLKTDDDWEEWLNALPLVDEEEPGLVLILARRTAPQEAPAVPVGKDPNYNEKDLPLKSERAASFPITVGGAPNAESGLLPSSGGRRSVRTLPFSFTTFRSISQKFCLHSSIARVINRSDVPIFSRAELEMGTPDGQTYPAYVYNCRTTNAWEMDLALTATHFPHLGMTYAVLFGCPISVERDVIKRLSAAGAAASYPLLLPGIFAELERNRHIKIVEDYMDDIEEKIFELDYLPSIEQQIHGPEGESRNRNKRSQWLDTTYLRNGLITWNHQLAKMAKHTDELGDTIFKPMRQQDSRYEKRESARSQESELLGPEIPFREGEQDWRGNKVHHPNEDEAYKSEMRKVGAKVNDRLQTIMEEYEDKTRECTMRIDGMVMATQWSHGETNVEIALATGRDSRHMRSISIVTMVFLPGTFFASVFSMQFFNWIPDGDATVVSHYFWIYVLVTVVATLATLGTWYYCVLWRHRTQKRTPDEEMSFFARIST
ncbi:hypothetical protein GGS26DRAFT_453179 [Hypomontagnella submonticulosa]|nr:hypothetical protein GGS26DRAFT_453179 [Hypomontagnella submonticulosa]